MSPWTTSTPPMVRGMATFSVCLNIIRDDPRLRVSVYVVVSSLAAALFQSSEGAGAHAQGLSDFGVWGALGVEAWAFGVSFLFYQQHNSPTSISGAMFDSVLTTPSLFTSTWPGRRMSIITVRHLHVRRCRPKIGAWLLRFSILQPIPVYAGYLHLQNGHTRCPYASD